MQEIRKIAFIGLGQMGLPMAKNLFGAGYPVVGYDAFDAARETAAHEGLNVASSLDDVLTGADIIITMLPNGKIVQDALLTSHAFRAAREGGILIDMSSSAPMQTRELNAAVAPYLRVIDAPVSGGVKKAKSGALTIMAGGDDDTLAEVLPLFEPLSAAVISCGPVGAGHAMKSINNYVSGAGVIAAVEAVRLGTAFGLSAETVVDVLNASSGKNNATEVKMKQFILSGSFGSGFALGLMAKDIGIAADLAEQLHLNLAGLKQTSELWGEAAHELGMNVDHTRIYEFIEGS